MSRTRLFATVVAIVGVTAALAAANAGSAPGALEAAALGEAEECMGLACPDSTHDVPEARLPAQSLSGSEEFVEQQSAGFYEYGLRNPNWGKRAVAYVIPPGQADKMPASVRDLPIVKAIASSTALFEDGSTVFVADRDIFGMVPAAELKARAAATRRERNAIRRRAAASQLSISDCPDNFFCIFDFQNLQGEGWGLHGIGTGWLSLSACCNNFNDQAESQQNRRARDSLLNRFNPPQGGTARYCAESGTQDFDLGNNFGGDGRNVASMWANTDSDQQC